MTKGSTPWRLRVPGLVAAAAVTLSACNQNPYAYSVNSFNEDGPQQSSAIQLSDPQIYARETMLNDRRREAEYLKRLLADSEKAEFEPQLKRVLQVAESLKFSASAGINPSLATQARRQEGLDRMDASLDQKRKELEQLELDRRLILARKRLDEASDQSGGQSDTTLPGADQTKINELNAKVEALTTDIKRLQEQLKQQRAGDAPIAVPAAGPVGDSSVRSSPQERFRDLQAYRDELRATLAGIELDDSHDHNGNSLFRLQFTATVAPGRHKDKYAVTRLTIRPPHLSYDDSVRIYKLWLSHVSFRLNGFGYRKTDTQEKHIDTAYQALATGQNLFRYIEYDLTTERTVPSGSPETVKIIVPPAYYETARDILNTPDLGNALRSLTAPTSATGQVLLNIILAQIQKGSCFSIKDRREILKLTHQSIPSIRDSESFAVGMLLALLPSSTKNELPSLLATSLRGMGDWSRLKGSQALERLLLRLFDIESQVDSYVGRLELKRDHFDRCAARFNGDELSPDDFMPWQFDELVYQAHFEAGRGAFAYAATPVELAQRVSTLASAITSLELGLSVAAQLQKVSGLDVAGNLSYLRSARGQIDTLERLPIVVGFSDRRSSEQTVGLRRNKQRQLNRTMNGELGAELHRFRPPVLQQGLLDAKSENDQCFPYQVWKERLPEAIKTWKAKYPIGGTQFDISDHDLEHCGWEPQKSQFGWIFGPRAVANPETRNIELRHGVHNYPVVADVSVPSWWPYVTFVLETGWVGNWQGSGNANPIIDDSAFVERRFFHRPLPRNRADMDGLTEALAYQSVGASLATTRILRVEPASVTHCGGPLTLLAYGSNVWRGTEAYLNGRKASEISVLPDMSGLAITFEDADKLQKTTSRQNPSRDTLVIWTRNGPAEHEVSVQRADTCASKSVVATPPGTAEVVPPYILGDAQKLVIKLEPVPDNVASAPLYVFVQGWSPVSLDSSKRTILPNGTLILDLSEKISEALPGLKTAQIGLKMAVSVRSGSVPKDYAFVKPTVYYPTANEAKATLAGPSKGVMDKLTATISIKLPEHADTAFPALNNLGAGKIEVTVKGEDKLKPQATGLKIDKGNLTFTLAFPSGQATEFAKADRTMSVKFAGNSGLPELACIDCLTFKPPVAAPAESKKP